jgi:hypothetical protein
LATLRYDAWRAVLPNNQLARRSAVVARSASAREQRLALDQATVGQLIEWQGRCVAGGLGKPSYSELLDALVAQAASRRVDITAVLRSDEEVA